MKDQRIDCVMYFVALVVLFLVLFTTVLGVFGQTHLAPDCPGPSLDCFNAVATRIGE